MEKKAKSLVDETPPQTSMVSSSSSSSLSSLLTNLSPDVIYTYILPRLDGESLLALSLVSSEFLHLCSDEKLWRKICTSKWPSLLDPIASNTISTFAGGFRSFFIDASRSFHLPSLYYYDPPPELIFAVDISFQQEPPFFSKLICKHENNSFRRFYEVNLPSVTSSSVQIDEEAMKEKLRFSWIIMDPSRKGAMNLSFRCVHIKMYPGSRQFVVVYEANKADEIDEKTTWCHMAVAILCRWNPIMNVLCSIIGVNCQITNYPKSLCC